MFNATTDVSKAIWARPKSSVIFLWALAFLSAPLLMHAQLDQAARDSLNRLSAEYHADMKRRIGLTTPNRPGPSGNPEAPNAANSDESRVQDYSLPDPLRLENGRSVTTPQAWWNDRRPELVELFDREMYGRVPDKVPPVRWKVVEVRDTNVGQFPMVEKTLAGIVDNSFRQHAGGHTTGPNWSTGIAWACRYWDDCRL